MELLLNSLWLLLSLAALLWCASRQRRLSKRDRDWARTILAIGLIALFLFPVISATDDLHPVQAVVEESAANKIVSAVHGAAVAVNMHPALSALLFALLLLLAQFALLGLVVKETSVKPRRVFLRRLDGRAPPVPAC